MEANDLILIAEPKLLNSRTDTADPSLDNVRTLNEDPKFTKSITLILSPILL
jgi:hypothetical protein